MSTLSQAFRTLFQDIYAGTRNQKNAVRITEELISRLGPNLSVNQITYERVQSLKSTLRALGNAESTINTKLAILSKYMNRLFRTGRLDSLPLIILYNVNHQSKRVRHLSTSEEHLLFSSLTEDHRMLAVFLMYTGCRFSEARRLQWQDIDPNKSISFCETKSDKSRTIPISTPVQQVLTYCKTRCKVSPFDFINYQTFYKDWCRAKASLNLTNVNQVVPHVLRHTCATRMIKHNIDPIRVKTWLGHASLNTTSRYIHLDTSDLQEANQVLEREYVSS